MSLLGDFVLSLYLVPYTLKNYSVTDSPAKKISNVDLDYQKMGFLLGR